ncbi:MAG TPA: tetratricopeptide repeat protein [Thermoanaerobaculaceae bacterium]|nr:tetratricopeptide repeat protein [Thermoanaerobaculaceae bacterium]
MYWSSLHAPFVFDDRSAILENPTILRLWPLSTALSPPGGGSPVQGRPLVNLSLAVNYALGGTDVFGYRLFNLGVHVLAALTLLAVLRLTLADSEVSRNVAGSALGLSFVIAVIWTVHPLLSEAVISVSQRAEAMAGLFCLLTLYFTIRGANADHPSRWYGLAITACALGVASKEVMAVAPLVVLAYDAIFLSGSVRKALRRRRGLYLGLALTWLLLGYLVAIHGFARGQAAGFVGPFTPWQYARTQCWAILHYLRLAFFPHPLVLDYGYWIARSVGEVLPGAVTVVTLLAGTVVALARVPWLGFLGVWFFAILSPSSSIVPLATQTVAEKRMYLPLVAVITAVVIGVHLGLERVRRLSVCQGEHSRTVLRWVPIGLAAIAACALGFATHVRTLDYRDAVSIWRDTTVKMPRNARAQNNLGTALLEVGRVNEALACFRVAVSLSPGYFEANGNTAVALERLGQFPEALGYMRRAVILDPMNGEAQEGLVRILVRMNRWDEALAAARAYVEKSPEAERSNYLYGSLLSRMGRAREALPYLQRARELGGRSTADGTHLPPH